MGVALRWSPYAVIQRALWRPPCGVSRVIQKRSQLYKKNHLINLIWALNVTIYHSKLSIHLLCLFLSFDWHLPVEIPSNQRLILRLFSLCLTLEDLQRLFLPGSAWKPQTSDSLCVQEFPGRPIKGGIRANALRLSRPSIDIEDTTSSIPVEVQSAYLGNYYRFN